MPSQLYTNTNVEFICGRNFTYNGKDYKLGDDFPQEDCVTNIETMVRTRYIIPVVESTDVKPRHFHREVRIKSEILSKLGVKQKSQSAKGEDYDPTKHTVAEVKDYVEEHPEQASEILEAEEADRDRKTLVEALEDEANKFHPANHTVDEVLEYLTSDDITDEEYERVLEDERNGKARKGILGDD